MFFLFLVFNPAHFFFFFGFLFESGDEEGRPLAWNQRERPGRGALHWTSRLADDALVGLSVFTGDGRPLVSATLSEHVDVDGLSLQMPTEGA